MADGREGFLERIARIKAAETESRFTDAPELAPERMGDLSTLRRNATGLSLSDFANSLFDIPTVRYGMPIAIGIIGFAIMSAFFPAGMHKIIASDEAYMERTGGVTPFNASEIAIERMNAFAEFSDQIQSLDAVGKVSR